MGLEEEPVRQQFLHAAHSVTAILIVPLSVPGVVSICPLFLSLSLSLSPSLSLHLVSLPSLYTPVGFRRLNWSEVVVIMLFPHDQVEHERLVCIVGRPGTSVKHTFVC